MEHVGHLDSRGSLGTPRGLRGMALFTLIWSGQTLSQLGSGLLGFALGVLVYQQTGSVTRFALIGLSVTIPGLLLSPLAGVLADRWDRRRLLILSNLGSALANLVLFFLVRSGRLELWQIYPVVVASACCMAFVWPAFSAATTLIVGKRHLARASGMNQMGASISQIIAPALAGVLLSAIGAGGIVMLNLASYLAAAAVLLLVRFPTASASAEGQAAAGSVADQTRAAWRFIGQRPGLRWLLLLFAGVNFTVGALTVLLTPLVLTFASPQTLGIVLSIASSGMLVGGILMSVWGGPRRRVLLVLSVLPLMGLLMLCAGLRPSATLVATVSFLFLLGFPVVTGSGQAIWQSKVPPDLQGRVFAVHRMVAGLAAPIAIIVAGPLADRVFEPAMAASGPLAASVGALIGVGPGRGIALMIVLLGGLTTVAATAGWGSRALRRVELEVPDAVPDSEAPAAAGADPLAATPAGRPPRPGAWLPDLRPVHVAACGLILAVTSVAAILSQRPPRALDLDAPLTAFSAARAQRHVEALAVEPHPVGSAAQQRARDYLLAELAGLGLEVEVQRTRDLNPLPGLSITHLVTVENVVARLPGTAAGSAESSTPATAPAPAVLLVAHYDSVPTSPGAGDNAAAVAALLETARALRAGPPMAGDVLLLFTDAEEVSLNGARAFVEQHRWARQPAVVLNFDARGHGGPVFMFETGSDEARWIPQLANTPHALASSFFSSVYRQLPNDTDFTIFRDAGFAGFNFAFIEGLTHYHTELDQPEDVSPGSLQHQGTYALELSRRLAGGRVGAPTEPAEASASGTEPTYFNIGRWLVHYPTAYAVPLSALAALGLLALLAHGLRRGQLSAFGIGQGFLAQLGALVAIPVGLTVIWLVVRDVAGVPMLMGSTPEAGRFMLAFAAFTLAAVSAWQRFLGHLISVRDLTAGALLWWLVLTLVTISPWLPRAVHYLFVWPLLFALVAFGVLLTQQRATRTVALLTVCAVPALMLWVPQIGTLYVGLQSLTELGGLPLISAVLLSGLLIPQLSLLTRRAWLPALAALSGVVLLVSAVARANSAATPRLSSVLYTVDADTASHAWFSFESEPSPWAQQLGLAAGERGSLAAFFPRLRSPRLTAPAPASSLAVPQLTVSHEVSNEVSDAVFEDASVETASGDAANPENAVRHWHLQLTAGEGAHARLLWVEPATAAISVRLDSTEAFLRARDNGQPHVLVELPIASPRQDLVVRARGTAPVTLVVVEQHEAMPNAVPRPPDELPRPVMSVVRSDVSLVRRAFELPPAVEGADVR